MSSAAVVGEASADLRDRLRAATTDDHQRLDRQLGALDLTGLSGYREFLEINTAALLPLEDALERNDVTTVFPDWPARSRRVAMLSDLAAVGGVARPLPPLGALGPAAVIGTMYVLEGSRLGARYLLKTVMQSADPTIRNATAYLAHGEGQRLWQSFLVRLEAFDLTQGDEERAVEAARAAFAFFARAIPVAA